MEGPQRKGYKENGTGGDQMNLTPGGNLPDEAAEGMGRPSPIGLIQNKVRIHPRKAKTLYKQRKRSFIRLDVKAKAIYPGQ